jgi:hypothetical protein
MGEPYLRLMKNVATNVGKRVEHIVQHGFEVLSKEHPTQQDVDSVWQEFEDLDKDVGSDASQAATDEMKERIVGKYQQRGMSLEDAEKYFEAKWKEILDKAEQVRNAAPKAAKAAKLLWLKIAAGVGTVTALVTFAISSGNNTGNQIIRNVEDDSRRWQAEADFQQHMSEFNALASALKAPLDIVPRMPDPVAAVAEAPLAVTIPVPVRAPIALRNTVEIRRVEATVGQVWGAMPDSHEQIERAAEHAQEGAKQAQPYQYAFQDPKSCSLRYSVQLLARM